MSVPSMHEGAGTRCLLLEVGEVFLYIHGHYSVGEAAASGQPRVYYCCE